MNPQFLWCTLDARDVTSLNERGDEHDPIKQLQAYAAIKSYGEMAHQPFGIVLEVGVQPQVLNCAATETQIREQLLGVSCVSLSYELDVAGRSPEREQALGR